MDVDFWRMNESVNLVDMYEICTGGVVADMCIKRVIISEADLAGGDTILDKPQRLLKEARRSAESRVLVAVGYALLTPG